MIENLTSQDFTDLAPGSLRVDFGDTALPLTVTELRALPPISPRIAPFAMVLEGPASPTLQQGIHTLIHPRHGPLELFLVPIGRSSGHTRYEIIFN